VAKKKPNEQQQREVVNTIIEEYCTQYETRAGQLHNRFVGFISEAKLPIDLVVTVLTMLLREATDIAFKKYMDKTP
jgi:uncharacterized protein YdiU (UPF0061 family)